MNENTEGDDVLNMSFPGIKIRGRSIFDVNENKEEEIISKESNESNQEGKEGQIPLDDKQYTTIKLRANNDDGIDDKGEDLETSFPGIKLRRLTFGVI